MKKRDLILIFSILAVAIALFLALELSKEEGARVVVKVDGQTIAEYPLAVDGRFELCGGSNILVIENGRAFISDADCPDKLCVHQGKISCTGEVITCLPHKLTVSVYGAAGDVELVG